MPTGTAKPNAIKPEPQKLTKGNAGTKANKSKVVNKSQRPSCKIIPESGCLCSFDLSTGERKQSAQCPIEHDPAREKNVKDLDCRSNSSKVGNKSGKKVERRVKIIRTCQRKPRALLLAAHEGHRGSCCLVLCTVVRTWIRNLSEALVRWI